MEESILQSKSFDLSVSVHKKVAELQKKQKEFLLSQWWAESVSNIALNAHMAKSLPTKRGFIIGLYAARKAANKSLFWTRLLAKTAVLEADFAQEVEGALVELIKMTQASITTFNKNRKGGKSGAGVAEEAPYLSEAEAITT
jgi:four helix bundle protein